MTDNSKKYIILLFKLIVVIGLGFVVYMQVSKVDNWQQLSTLFFEQCNTTKWPYIAFAILLMPLNWLVESIKWKKLILPFEDIKLSIAIKAILLGIVMALITPARIGEYAGRLSIIREKSKSLGATLLGSIAQNLITLIIGLIAIILSFDHFFEIDEKTSFIYYLLTICVIIGLSWLYFHMDIVLSYMKRWSFFNKWTSYFPDLKIYSNTLLGKVLALSLLRYIIYSTQYLMLLIFFGIEADISILLAGIAILFLIQSGIPLPPVLSIFARGEIAILIWSSVSDNTVGALAVSFLLWFINLILPALIGLWVMFSHKIFQSKRIFKIETNDE